MFSAFGPNRSRLASPSALGAWVLSSELLIAQVVTRPLGKPGATPTLQDNQLPASEPKFGGVIKESLEGSKTWWPPRSRRRTTRGRALPTGSARSAVN